MDREEIKALMSFLDTASDKELTERRSAYQDAVNLLPAASDARMDYKFMLRRTVEEQAARFNLGRVRAARERRLGH